MSDKRITNGVKRLKGQLKSGNLSFYTCILCLATLSLKIHWLPPFMIVLVLLWFLEKQQVFTSNKLFGLKTTNLFLIFLALFIWQVIGLFFTESISSGAERIIKRASFLLFPLALFYPSDLIKLKIKLLLKLFTIFILIYLIYCFGVALNNSITINEGKLIFNQYHEYYTYESFFAGYRLSGSVHPTYLAMYLIVSLIITLDEFFDKTLKVVTRSLWLLVSIIFLVVIYLLSSRAGILAVAIVLPLYLIVKFYRQLPAWLIITLIVVFITVSGILISKNSRLKYSFDEIAKENIDDAFQKDARILIWRSAFGIIKHNLLVGVGTGDASEELKKEFLERGYSEGFYDNLNAHNQFLEILLENGLIGLILFLGILGYIGFISFSEHNYVLMLFLIIMIVFFMFESILNRLAGITFFPFFTFLLIHLKSHSITE